MSLFRHPHLTRGIIQTPRGAFTISRGIVDVPEDVGFSMGWSPIDEDDDRAIDAQKYFARQAASPDPAQADR